MSVGSVPPVVWLGAMNSDHWHHGVKMICMIICACIHFFKKNWVNFIAQVMKDHQPQLHRRYHGHYMTHAPPL